jgi:hypothetical protein
MNGAGVLVAHSCNLVELIEALADSIYFCPKLIKRPRLPIAVKLPHGVARLAKAAAQLFKLFANGVGRLRHSTSSG